MLFLIGNPQQPTLITLNNIDILLDIFINKYLYLGYFILYYSMRRALVIGITSTFTALNVVGRIMLTILPNISPVAPLTLLSGYLGGPITGFLVGSLSMFLSDLIIGAGPWTLITSFFMGLVGLSGFLIRRFSNDHVLLFILGYLSVLAYDLLTSVILMYAFGVPPLIAAINLFLPMSFIIPYPMGPAHEFTSSIIFLSLVKSLHSYVGDRFGEII